MSQVFLNGEYMDKADAKVSVFDRGFMFADGVYEVVPVFNGKAFLFAEHIERLRRSLKEIKIAEPKLDYKKVAEKLITQTNFQNCFIYIQITRGVTNWRNHQIDDKTQPTVLMYIQEFNLFTDDELSSGFKACLAQDIRWHRCDIKSISLLPNILIKSQAAEMGCMEAILHRDGSITEATASNVFVVFGDTVKTPPKSDLILGGITRDYLLKIMKKNSINIVEERISIDDLHAASEIWLSSSTKGVIPVLTLEPNICSFSAPGPIWESVYKLFKQEISMF